MSISSQTVLSLVVVVDKVGDRLVVWHVNVGPAVGLSRLAGAWVVDLDRVDDIKTLTAGYDAVLCRGAVDGVEGVAAVVDLDATVDAVRAEVAAVDELFTEHQAGLANKLIRPEWPVIVHPAEAQPMRHDVDERVRPTLELARGIADLADAWADFESLRVARSFLAEQGGPHARSLPLVVR